MSIALTRLQTIAHLTWGHYPTPLEPLPRLREALVRKLGHDNLPTLYIKRDDYTGPGLGGNKVRKLEYVLAQAAAEGAEFVLTVGGEKSNHARVTAAMCARLGLACELFLNPPAVPHAGLRPASLAADQLYGAVIHPVANAQERNTQMAARAAELRAQGRRVVEVPLGASIPLGALGFVRAVGELHAQLGGTRISHIFHASSSAGTQAGLLAGCQVFDVHAQVIGISPDDPGSGASISAHVSEIIHGLSAMLHQEFDAAATVDDAYVGAGYGIDSPAGTDALALLARTEGVLLDPVYTAKAMAGLLDWIQHGRLTADDDVLFWHTGGHMALWWRE